jgi:hypothetical protein
MRILIVFVAFAVQPFARSGEIGELSLFQSSEHSPIGTLQDSEKKHRLGQAIRKTTVARVLNERDSIIEIKITYDRPLTGKPIEIVDRALLRGVNLVNKKPGDPANLEGVFRRLGETQIENESLLSIRPESADEKKKRTEDDETEKRLLARDPAAKAKADKKAKQVERERAVLDARYASTILRQCQLLVEMKKFPEAVIELKHLIRDFPDSPSVEKAAELLKKLTP